jgi:hypothetical protein
MPESDPKFIICFNEKPLKEQLVILIHYCKENTCLVVTHTENSSLYSCVKCDNWKIIFTSRSVLDFKLLNSCISNLMIRFVCAC